MEEKSTVFKKVFEGYKNEILDQYSIRSDDWSVDFREKVWSTLMFRFFGEKVEGVLDEYLYGDFLGERVGEFMEVLGAMEGIY